MDRGRFGLGLGSFIGHLLRPTNAVGGVEVTVIQGWLRSDANLQAIADSEITSSLDRLERDDFKSRLQVLGPVVPGGGIEPP